MRIVILNFSALQTAQKVLLVAGFSLWIIAYLLIIRACFKGKTFGVPWACICLNLSWEVFMGFYCPHHVKITSSYCPGSFGIWLWLLGIWCLLDTIIFVQFLVYGRPERGVLERWFYPIAFTFLFISMVTVPLFIIYYNDPNGLGLSWILNLVMSIMFVRLVMLRPDLQGLPLGAAWAKMLGSLAMVVAFPQFSRSTAFLYLLALFVFTADCIYIHLLTTSRKALSRGTDQALNAAAA